MKISVKDIILDSDPRIREKSGAGPPAAEQRGQRIARSDDHLCAGFAG